MLLVNLNAGKCFEEIRDVTVGQELIIARSFGMVWYWYGMICYGMAFYWYGVIWCYGMVLYWQDMVLVLVWCGMIWYCYGTAIVWYW
jgi:hypothetical protein